MLSHDRKTRIPPLYVVKPRRAFRWDQSVVRFIRRYAMFNGRASRSEYWWWMLTNAVVMAAIGFASWWWGNGLSVLMLVWVLVTLLPTLSLGSRRLQDSGMSRYWCVLPYIGDGCALLIAALTATFTKGVVQLRSGAFPNVIAAYVDGGATATVQVAALTIVCDCVYVALMLRQSRSRLPNAKQGGPTLIIPQSESGENAYMTV
ncbi:MAG: DUF805 domain-containing protein [Bifidobacterium psychraerophilum]|uniref:DUF805 domain-containing protein n=1 Tax=Bifidobacterium psychraerophilum TaxID=218140 RepID=UPI0039E7D098